MEKEFFIVLFLFFKFIVKFERECQKTKKFRIVTDLRWLVVECSRLAFSSLKLFNVLSSQFV